MRSRYTIPVGLGPLLAVFFSGSVQAQDYTLCLHPNFTLNYEDYANVSTDGTYLYTSVITDGSASMGYYPAYCGTPMHTPKAYNMIGGVGGWGGGPAGCATCYISYQNNQSIAATQGTDYEFDWTGEVDCSMGGIIFNPPITVHTYSIRLSAYIFAGLSGGRCAWVPSCAGKCSSQYTTNTFDGVCFTTGPYKQCFDILQDGVCWDYRTFCYGKTAPGICTN
jgi:hypothetical protein